MLSTPPVALTIGGLDPCCGAGIGADLRTMAAARVWGCAVCAALTVQSTRGLRAVRAVPTSLLSAQVEELAADLRLGAVKTGALGSAANARWVAGFIGRHGELALVVDPVLRASRTRPGGRALSGPRALGAMRELGSVATVLTPNIPEAETLLDRPIRNPAEARRAAVDLLGLGARAVLLKGGHLPIAAPSSRRTVVDWLAIGDRIVRLGHRRREVEQVHGTGCALSALLAAGLARGLAAARARAKLDDDRIVEVARWATRRLARMLSEPLSVGSGAAVIGA